MRQACPRPSFLLTICHTFDTIFYINISSVVGQRLDAIPLGYEKNGIQAHFF